MSCALYAGLHEEWIRPGVRRPCGAFATLGTCWCGAIVVIDEDSAPTVVAILAGNYVNRVVVLLDEDTNECPMHATDHTTAAQVDPPKLLGAYSQLENQQNGRGRHCRGHHGHGGYAAATLCGSILANGLAWVHCGAVGGTV